MAKNTLQKFLLFLLLSLGSGLVAAANNRPISLQGAISTKRITVKATGLGGYCGQCLHLELTNNTDTAWDVKVNPGLIFVPEDTTYQNLVAWGSETVSVAAKSTGEVNVLTFCGKSYAHSPARNLRFNYWKRGDSNLVKTLVYAKKNKITPYVVQDAVWMFTNNHKLCNLYYEKDMAGVGDFVQFLAKIKHEKLPTSFTESMHFTNTNEAVVNRDSVKMVVPMKWNSSADEHVKVTVYKGDGTIYREIPDNKIIDKHGTTVLVVFNPRKDRNGEYRIVARDTQNKIWDQKVVFVDFDDE